MTMTSKDADGPSGRRVIAAGILAAIATGAVLFPDAAHADSRPPVGRRLFTQNFDGDRLNLSRWSPCYWWATRGCTNLSNNELQWYVPEQVQLANGTLRLIAKPAMVVGIHGRPFGYVSGLVSNLSPTRSNFEFTYGYVEARARIPKGAGLWSALWMLPTSRESEPEIDIFETIGRSPHVASMHVHYLEDGEPVSEGHTWRSPTSLARGWHTYGLYWSPDVLIWYVDGTPQWFVTDTPKIPDEPMYLLANLAVGGRYAGKPDENTPFPATLRFDSIKVWSLPGR
jgi:beta-glucanase (GH16 family)